MGIPSTVSIGAFLLFMYYPYLLGSTVRIGIEALTFIVKKTVQLHTKRISCPRNKKRETFYRNIREKFSDQKNNPKTTKNNKNTYQ